jgi:hypothetical protein
MFETLKSLLETQQTETRLILDSLVDILRDEERKLQDKARQSTSYSIGGNFRAHSSGFVKFERGYIQHGSYGFTTKWDYVLKIGTNIDGGGKVAVAECKRIFEMLKDEVEGNSPIKMSPRQYDFVAEFEDGKIIACYEYGSSYCTVMLRFAK